MTNLLRSLFVVACLLPSLGQAASVTLNPTADAYVQAGANANINFGNATRLRSQTVDGTTINDYESYLKFDTVTTTGQITSAKLRLYSATSGVGSVAVTAHGVADTNWNESTITWNNKPARGTAFGTAMVSGTSYIWREIDVTDHILQERNAGRSLVSLGLANTASSSVYAHANSRNAEFNWPQLVIVTAPANAPPTVSLTAPANGSSYTAPATVNLSANASDSDGSITKVEFYNGVSLIGTDTIAPYTFTWSNVAAGSYSLTAKATDNAGAVTTSAAVSISVTSPPPPPPSVSLYYLYADHLNTPRVATDSSNKVVWRWDSDAFGTSAANEDPDEDGVKFTYNPRFPGQYFDKETGLHYNYFRDYEPGSGRYIESDPIGLNGGLNLYGYVDGNPLSFTDPWGLAPKGSRSFGSGSAADRRFDRRHQPPPPPGIKELKPKENEKGDLENFPDAIKANLCPFFPELCFPKYFFVCAKARCTPKCGEPYIIDYFSGQQFLVDPETPCQCLQTIRNPEFRGNSNPPGL